MRVLVAGGRSYANRFKFWQTMLQYATSATVIIHGCATGADRLADEWATENGKEILRFPAQWSRYRRSAGPIRNGEMLDVGKPDFVITFPGNSGTANMITQASREHIRRRLYGGSLPIIMINSDPVY